MAKQPEHQFGKYVIDAEIGRGGFGTVFRAVDTTLDRPVALKILAPLLMRDRGWVGRFRREARVMARLDHPHIVPIYEIGTHEGRLFLAMKLIDGPNLADQIDRQGTFSWEATVELIDQLASALDYAHREGLVHRDLKPGNILLSNGSAMLTDFGLSRLASDNSMSVSMTGGVIGTPAYIAPESWEGGEVSGRADQYSLACLVSEMLTGDMLFTGKTPPEIMMAHFKPPKFPEVWPEGVPPGVEEILQTAFARDPADRFETCRALVEALRNLESDILAGPYASLEQAIAQKRWENALDLADEIRARDNNYRDIRALEQKALDGLAAEQNAAAAAQWREQAKAAKAEGNLDVARMAARKWQELTGEEAAEYFLKNLTGLESELNITDEPSLESNQQVQTAAPSSKPASTEKSIPPIAQPIREKNSPSTPVEQIELSPHLYGRNLSSTNQPAQNRRSQPETPKSNSDMLSNLWLWGGLVAVIVIGVIFWAAAREPETVYVEVTRVVEGEAVAEVEEAVVVEEVEGATGETVQIRWYIGLGGGTDEVSITAQEEIVAEWNARRDDIELILEIVDNSSAYDVLNTQLAAGNPPDIVGPMGTHARSSFHGAWLDLDPLIAETNYELSDFDPALVDFYKVEGQGQLGIPFVVFPSYIFVNKDLFDEAGLEYPPQEYGARYVLNGEEVPWNINTLREVAMLLTVDVNGNDATSPDFDPENITQFGFGPQWTDIRGQFTMFGAGNFVAMDGRTAQFPGQWLEAAKWYHQAYFEDYFVPDGVYASSDLLGGGNWFESGNLAMAHIHLWYAMCCLGNLPSKWDTAVLPANASGEAVAKMHEDTFGILADTDHPKEAFEVITYLVGEKAAELAQIYGGMPARLSLQNQYFERISQDTFGITPGTEINWDVVVAGMSYPDNPHHEEWMPAYLEARDRYFEFGVNLANDPNMDIEVEASELIKDLQVIFDAAN